MSIRLIHFVFRSEGKKISGRKFSGLITQDIPNYLIRAESFPTSSGPQHGWPHRFAVVRIQNTFTCVVGPYLPFESYYQAQELVEASLALAPMSDGEHWGSGQMQVKHNTCNDHEVIFRLSCRESYDPKLLLPRFGIDIAKSFACPVIFKTE